MATRGGDADFERLLASTQRLASQIKQQHHEAPPQHIVAQQQVLPNLWQPQQQLPYQQQPWHSQPMQQQWMAQQQHQRFQPPPTQGLLSEFNLTSGFHSSSDYSSSDMARTAVGSISLDSDLAAGCMEELLADGLFDEWKGATNQQPDSPVDQQVGDKRVRS